MQNAKPRGLQRHVRGALSLYPCPHERDGLQGLTDIALLRDALKGLKKAYRRDVPPFCIA